MVMLRCNYCLVVNNTVFGTACISCKTSLDITNTTFVLEITNFTSSSTSNSASNFSATSKLSGASNFNTTSNFCFSAALASTSSVLPRFPGFSASLPAKRGGDLEKDAAAAKENFDKVLGDVKGLEEKVERSKTLKKKTAELFSSNDFMSPTSIQEARQELDLSNARIERSDEVNRRILQLTREISELKKSADYTAPGETSVLARNVVMLERKIKRGCEIQDEISKLEKDPEFLLESEVQELEVKLANILKILGPNQKPERVQEEATEASAAAHDQISEVLLVHERARGNLECVICFDVPRADTRVVSCRHHHLLCCDCAPNLSSLSRCPVCRQDFGQVLPTRNRLAEKMIKDLC